MATIQRSRIDRKPTAVYVRLVAFILALGGILAVPASVLASITGVLTQKSAAITAAAGIGLVITAALAVRPFDPLRG